MDNQNSQIISCNDNQNIGQQPEKTSVKDNRNIWEKIPNNVKYPIISFLVALVSYSIMKLMIPEEAGYIFTCVIAAFLAAVALWAISKAVKRRYSQIEFGSSVGYWIFLFLTINLVNNFFTPGPEIESQNNAVIQESHAVRIDVLYPGVTVFNLKAGEESSWLAFPSDGLWDYSVASPDYAYTLVFSDGTSYLGGPSVVIPEKNHVQFKIVANKAQFVTVNIKQKT